MLRRRFPAFGALVALPLLLLGCGLRHTSTAADRANCANERAFVQIDSSLQRSTSVPADSAELVVYVRSVQLEPLKGAIASFRPTRGGEFRATADARGIALLRVPSNVGQLIVGWALGYNQGRLGLRPRAGFSDTVRVLTRCGFSMP